jgi:AraC family L-rhamnose operon regulatory protein RhaS
MVGEFRGPTFWMVSLVNHYHRKITLHEVARACGTNRKTLNQEFKQATGKTVMGYVIRLRVRRACQLLRDTALPVAEIAELIGYADVTHFGRIFRKHTQLAPGNYRARHRKPGSRL